MDKKLNIAPVCGFVHGKLSVTYLSRGQKKNKLEMNVIQTEVVFPIAYTVMHYYFISKNLFPNHISYQDIQSTRKKKKKPLGKSRQMDCAQL